MACTCQLSTSCWYIIVGLVKQQARRKARNRRRTNTRKSANQENQEAWGEQCTLHFLHFSFISSANSNHLGASVNFILRSIGCPLFVSVSSTSFDLFPSISCSLYVANFMNQLMLCFDPWSVSTVKLLA